MGRVRLACPVRLSWPDRSVYKGTICTFVPVPRLLAVSRRRHRLCPTTTVPVHQSFMPRGEDGRCGTPFGRTRLGSPFQDWAKRDLRSLPQMSDETSADELPDRSSRSSVAPSLGMLGRALRGCGQFPAHPLQQKSGSLQQACLRSRVVLGGKAGRDFLETRLRAHFILRQDFS